MINKPKTHCFGIDRNVLHSPVSTVMGPARAGTWDRNKFSLYS